MSSSKSKLKRVGIGVGIAGLFGAAVLAWAVIRPGPMDFAGGETVSLGVYTGLVTGVPADFPGRDDPIARGAYLTHAADCVACHTVKDGVPFAGGRAFVTDFGTIYAPNITADGETGIGNWTDADFLRAVHEGVGKDGKPYYPAFPYASYTYLTDEDVLAIKAYIFSLPPVRNTVQENDLRFPFNQRWLMWFWSTMYNPKSRYEPRPERSPEWNRGAYLTEALGHCGDCHTPRTPFQSLDNRNKFKGGVIEGWQAYNISSDRISGIGAWDRAELARYLSTGRSEKHGSAFGPMAEAVHLSLSRLTPADIDAMVTYLQSVPAVRSANLPAMKADEAPSDPMKGVPSDHNPKGRELYASACAGCHGWTGGSLVAYARLTGVRAVNDRTAANVALAVLNGSGELPGTQLVGKMPAFGRTMSDSDVAAVANYVTARFGAEPSSITAKEVRRLREMQ